MGYWSPCKHSHYCPDGPAVYLLKLHYEFLIMSYYADVQSGLHKSLNTKMLHPPGSDTSIRHARTAVTAASLCNKDMKGSRWGFERELQKGKFQCFSHCKAQMDSITVYFFNASYLLYLFNHSPAATLEKVKGTTAFRVGPCLIELHKTKCSYCNF